ncbi:MAG: dienelactone hydrolase family protein [Pseudomonadota bacterium]
MQLKKASDFDPEVLKLFDKFVHGVIDRRAFLSGASKYAVGGMSAAMLLDALNPKFAAAQQVPKDDKRINARYVEYSSPDGYGTIKGYLATPANATGKLQTVLVVHENRGLNPHIEDIVRRLALDNFQAFAPDALTPFGGYPGDEDKARESFAKLDQEKSRNDFIAAVNYLKTLPSSSQKIGAVGFCYGGGIVNMLATRFPDLGAAVPFYGGQPAAAEAAKIKAPLQLHYAGKDERINAGWPAFEAALKAAGVKYEGYIYPGVEHGFNNDTTPRFDPPAAKLAWDRTIAFFKANLA